MSLIDIEDVDRKFTTLINKKDFLQPSVHDVERYTMLIKTLLQCSPKTQEEVKVIKHRHSFGGKNSFLYKVFLMMDCYNETDGEKLKHLLRIKKGKSHSGVLVITVFTSPYPEYIDKSTGESKKQMFTCKWNCSYCPNEPGQPRSYLKGEPGVLRANREEFDPIRQMHSRMDALSSIGHPIDKLEVIVLGGTWTSYPEEYREDFCRDVYYAANTYYIDRINKRKAFSLEEEKKINKMSKCKVIGLTLETRPDTIDKHELINLRKYGCTRVQLGIQHLHQDVLDKVKRRCTIEQVHHAIRLLKDCGFKVDGHFMPNLPGSTLYKDQDMFLNLLLGTKLPVPSRKYDVMGVNCWEKWSISDPNTQVDQWKVYPCAIVPWTDIEEWYKKGDYIPYNESEMANLLLEMKAIVFPWIRLNRIVRDIPKDYIIASSDKSNLRQELTQILDKEGKVCRCIRCREVKNMEWDGKYVVVVREYEGSGGTEYFISAESSDNKVLYGFVRLRFPSTLKNAIFPELDNIALIRELHVYGQLHKVNDSKSNTNIQHKGIGKHLMTVAEKIGKVHGSFKKFGVIAGEGTKAYYEALGYIETGIGSYMIKTV